MSERPVRTFVAVLLPDAVRERLATTVEALRPRAPGHAWVKEENLHLTLRFLGGLDPEALIQAGEAVAEAATAVAPFAVEVEGLGGFPGGRAPRVVWAGVGAGGEELGRLHGALEAALRARGFPGEGRAYHPHVTLARARDRRGAAPLPGVPAAGPRFGRVRVGALHLMRSELGRQGSRYSVLLEARLGGRAGDGGA